MFKDVFKMLQFNLRFKAKAKAKVVIKTYKLSVIREGFNLSQGLIHNN